MKYRIQWRVDKHVRNLEGEGQLVIDKEFLRLEQAGSLILMVNLRDLILAERVG